MPFTLAQANDRLSPPDAGPLRVGLYGTVFGHRFFTGWWTTKYGSGNPPAAGQFEDIGGAAAAIVGSNVIIEGGWWRTKEMGSEILLPFTPAAGSATAPTGIALILSQSATWGFGGKAIDITGVYRTVRAFDHMPRGCTFSNEEGVNRYDTAGYPAIGAFLTAFAAEWQPTDQYGRTLTLYPYMSITNNSFYQKKRGF